MKPATCTSLEEVRAHIDGIDTEIIHLLAARSTYVAQAIRFKSTAAEVPAPARVEEVIRRVRERAQAVGLNPSIVEPTYRAMIGAFIDWERRCYAEAARTKSGATATLATTLLQSPSSPPSPSGSNESPT